MEFESGSTSIYNCPVCNVDTPHNIKGRRGDMYGIICSNCHCGSLVRELDLRVYQLKWEEELREILDSLVEHSFGYDDDD